MDRENTANEHALVNAPRTSVTPDGTNEPAGRQAMVPTGGPPTKPVPASGGSWPTPTHVPAPAVAWPPTNNNVPAINVNTHVHTNVGGPTILIAGQQTGPSFLVRALWYLFVGWWLSAIGIVLGYLFLLTIVGIPVAFALFNRVPQMLTLRPRTTGWSIETVDGVTRIHQGTIVQRPWFLRAVYFLLVGWWVGAFWMVFAWVLSLLIIPIPLSLWMLDRVSGVVTLQRH